MDNLIQHLLRNVARRLPDREAVIDGGRRLTFARLEEATDRLAWALVDAGLGRSDRVGIFLPKCGDEVIAMLAVAKAGGVFVPINPLLFAEQVGHILRDCRPTAIVTTRDRITRLAPMLAAAPSVRLVVLTDGGTSPVEG